MKRLTFTLALMVIALAALFLPPLSPRWPSTLAGPDAQGLKRSADFYFDVAAGDVRSHSSVNKFGSNPDVDSAAVEDIWDGGGTWVAPTVAQVHAITSTSVTDAITGTGARTMQVYGLDSAGVLINETVTLSGGNSISTTNSYLMIHRLVVRTAGTGGANAGIIRATAGTDRTVTAQINAGNNQTLMAIYQIPADNDGCMLNFYASLLKAVGATATVNVIIKAKPEDEVYQVKHKLGIIKDGTSAIEHKFFVPNCFEPLTIVKMSADSNVDDVDMAGGFDMVLHPN